MFGPPAQTGDALAYLDSYVEKEPLYVIYQHSPFHWYWHLDHWLANVKRPIIMETDTSGKLCRAGSIVVVNHLSIKEGKYNPAAYIDRCKSQGVKKIGVFHTGDIEFNQKYDYYSKAAFVYRNHYPSRKQMEAKGMPPETTKLMPLGSKNLQTISLDDFRQTIPSTQRKHWCGFIGALAHSPTRKSMANGLQSEGLIPSQDTYKMMNLDAEGPKCAVYFSTSDWNNKQQMEPQDYRQMMQQTVFSLVPLGRGPDSFRLYEALELGSIPIITDIDAFRIPLGDDHPLPTVTEDEWGTRLPKMLKAYWSDRAAVLELQMRVFKWWVQWKEDFRQGLADDVESLFR